jgi:hypothetical protein
MPTVARSTVYALTILCLLLARGLGDELAECRRLAPKYQAVCEYRLPDGSRVDLLSDTHAWEVDWAKKWPEGIGQALFYGLETGRQPGVILLVRDERREARYIARARRVCERYGIELRVEPVTAGKPPRRPSAN